MDVLFEQKTRRARFTQVAVALAALTLAAGCGGDDDETAGGPRGAVGAGGQGESRPGDQGDRAGAGGSGTADGGGEAPSGKSGGAEEGDPPAQGAERGEAEGEGAESAPESGDAGPPAKAAFVRRANGICARGRAGREQALARHARRNADEPAAERVDESLQGIYVPSLESQIAELRRLTPPSGDGAEVAAIVEAMEGWVALVKSGGRSAKGQIDQALSRTSMLAHRYGLTECASG